MSAPASSVSRVQPFVEPLFIFYNDMCHVGISLNFRWFFIFGKEIFIEMLKNGILFNQVLTIAQYSQMNIS